MSLKGDSGVALSVRNFRKEYGTDGDSVVAVDDVSFEIDHGEVVALLGPNGAGKTTTIKGVLGLLVPSSGTVRVAGVDASTNPRSAYEHVSGVLEGARNVYWRLTVRENLRFFSGLQGMDLEAAETNHRELLDSFDLEAKSDELVKNLSRGMKQKVAIACALARDTPIVFLDEPTLGLDVEMTRRLQSELSRLTDQNRTIVLSSHDMDVVQAVADRVIIMNEGRIVVDDCVENLIDLFQTQRYEITVAEPFPEEFLDRLESTFSLQTTESTTDTTTFEVTLSETNAFYDLVSELESIGATIQAVHSVEPDLEEVFLSVIDRRSDGSWAGDETSLVERDSA